MVMMKKKFDKLNNYVYEEVLDNGLRIYICNVKRKNIYVEMTVLYGSKDICFKKDGEDFINTYPGVAHLLEHLMYKADGEFDPSRIYEENGAANNAFTSKKTTSYYFCGSTNFESNLDTLLTMVSTLNVSTEDVEQEKKVIRQELLRDADNPKYIAYKKCMENTILNDSFRYDNGGEINDLSKISLDMVQKCFDYFYRPSNMFLVICGDVNPEKVIKQVKNFYKDKSFSSFEVTLKKYDEPVYVFKEKEIAHADVSNKNIVINYKLKKPKLDKFKMISYFKALLILKFGPLSQIYDSNLRDSNYVSNIEYGSFYTDDYAFLSFNVVVWDKADDVISLIDDTLKNGSLNEKYTDVYKKLMIRDLILDFENPGDVASLIQNNILTYGDIHYDIYNEIRALDVLDFKKFVSTLDFSNRSVVICEK